MKPSIDLAPLWRCANSRKPLLYYGDFPAEDRDTLVREGLLREAGHDTTVQCPHCPDEDNYVEVVMKTRVDGSVLHCGRCPECGFVELKHDNFALLAPDYEAVALCLSLALDMSKPVMEKVPGHLWKLGQARFNQKTRFVWVVRAPEGIPVELLPSSGVVFTLGHIPPGSLPRTLLPIPAEEAVYWDEGLRVDESVCEASIDDAEAGTPTPERRTRTTKGASMLDLRRKLIAALQDHVRTQQDTGRQSLAEGVPWKLSPPPRQADLARLCGVSEASISRALRYPILEYYMQMAADEEAVLTFCEAGH